MTLAPPRPPVSRTSSFRFFPPADGKAAFCIFLKTEFCEENVEFWTACEDFKTLTSHKDLVSKANSIYEEFIRSEAPKEVMKPGIWLVFFFMISDRSLRSSKVIQIKCLWTDLDAKYSQVCEVLERNN